jgi:hypothetical protein
MFHVLLSIFPIVALGQTCVTIGHMCKGAAGHPFVPTRPCCNSLAKCQPAPNLGSWGSFCVKTTQPTDLCKGLRARRKEILEMTSSEWARYAGALDTLRRNGVYTKYVQIHSTFKGQAHGGCFFLPWHRQFLFEFERELNKVAPGVTIPYWDWTKTSPRTGEAIFNAFTNDPVWDRAGGGAGNAPIPGPFFRNWFADGRTCLRDFFQNRGNVGGQGISWTFSSSQQIARLAAGRDPFSTFSNVLELSHGTVHVAVGGTMSIVATSPTDPIFYSHHAYVDKIWSDWQNSGNGNSFGGTQPNPTRSCSANGEVITPPEFGRTVSQILTDISPCTTYSRNPNAGPTARFILENENLSIHQSSSDSAFYTSPADKAKYQKQINEKKRNEPGSYRSQVEDAVNTIDSMTRANRFMGLPENYIQSGVNLYEGLLYKLGVDAVHDRGISSQSNDAIRRQGEKASASNSSTSGGTNSSSV